MATQDAVSAIDAKALDGLKATLRGELIRSGESGYDEARKVWNAMIDKRPALIVRAADVADVIAAVNFARDHKLSLAIRGGGHNVGGFGTCDDGVVVDLSRMRSVRVDPESRTARAEGGATWGDMDHATHAFGLATPGGVIGTTGIAGLTLGGGIGHLTRQFGLSCDNLISVDVVTADGKLVTASETRNPDLFWAVRGGGGNFGVVTSFEYRLHPVSMVYGGPILYPVEKSREALRLFRTFLADAPPELNAFFAYLLVPPVPAFPVELHDKPVCGIVVCYTGPIEKGDALVRPLRQFGPPLVDFLGPIPHPALNGMFDFTAPKGMQSYWKADFIGELNDDIIEQHVKHGPQVPVGSSTMHIYPIDGAAAKVAKNATAFGYRDSKFVHVIAAMYPEAADTPRCMEWVKGYFNALHPLSSGGAYVNFMMEEGEERIHASYAGNYEKLTSVKKKYDPQNLFRINQNIKPS
jgi:FAD/FMN-containing dehydrogenase